jgi:hypothetical protein
MLPSGSIMMLDLTGLDHSLRTLLRAAALAGIAGRIGPLLDRLGAALSTEGVDLRSVGAVFDGETAVAIVPGGGSPALVVVSRPRDLAAARATLASLEVPLAQLFPAPANGPGQVAEFNDVQVDGVTVHQLVLAPGLQLDYTVFGGLVVVSTSMRGIAGVVGRTASLSRDREYVEAVGARPDRVTSLLFLDFSQLLRLGEQTGLMSGASFDALLPDLEKVRAIGLYSTSGESDTTAELHLQIP